jgi:hypothetical protein
MFLSSLFARRPLLAWSIVVAVVVTAVYTAFSSGMLRNPSPHFHFVDMAASFLDGRLDTDTPRRTLNAPPRPEDRRGLQNAVNRHLAGPGGRNNGWNDWASYRVLTLKGGEVVKGVFPWKDVPGARQKEFWTLDGRLMVIDVDREVKTGCNPARPYARCDEVVYQISFPPFPAVAMMPLVAIWGYDVHDVVVTLLVAVLAAVLMFLWFARMRRENLVVHGVDSQLWLVALFAFGTAFFYSSIRGQVWFTALVFGAALHVAYLLAAQDVRRPVLAGLLFGLGVATRTPLLFAGVFFPLEAFFPRGKWLGGEGKSAFWKAFGKLIRFALPAAAIGATLAWLNWVRWQSPTEFGHLYLLEGTRGPTREHGLFNFVFLNGNLGAALTNMPRLLSEAPFVLITRHGLGLMASTPVFLAMLGTPKQPPADLIALDPAEDARRRSLQRHLLVTVLAVALPGLVYQNDGWQQFSYRFAIDFLPPLMGFFALRVPFLTRNAKLLILLAIVVQAFGAVTFGRIEQFYYD